MKEIHIQCPYCLEAISISLDIDFYGHKSIIADCKKCNKKIEVSYIVENAEIKTYSYNSIEENEF